MDAGQQFITAFNDIESHFRRVLRVDEHIGFAKLVRDYASRKSLPLQHRDALPGILRTGDGT